MHWTHDGRLSYRLVGVDRTIHRARLGRTCSRLGRVRAAARRAVLRRCGDVRSALLTPGGTADHLCEPSHRRSRRGADDLGVDRRPRSRRDPLVDPGRPHRPGQGDDDLRQRRDHRRTPRSLRAHLRVVARRSLPRGLVRRRHHHRRSTWPAGGESGGRNRRVARGSLHRRTAVRARRTSLRQARPRTARLLSLAAIGRQP